MTSVGLESGENPIFPSCLDLVLRGQLAIEAGLGTSNLKLARFSSQRSDRHHSSM